MARVATALTAFISYPVAALSRDVSTSDFQIDTISMQYFQTITLSIPIRELANQISLRVEITNFRTQNDSAHLLDDQNQIQYSANKLMENNYHHFYISFCP